MKGMIRWSGLGVFGFVAAVIVIFSYFFLDNLIKRVIETQGSAMVGARVELGGAKLSFSPTGLELSRLQITNPDDPMRNIVEIDRLAMAIDPLRLLQRKIIIEEMTATGVRPDTVRQKSGALPATAARQKKETTAKTKEGFKLPSLQIPDVKEVLAKEQLKTVALAQEYQAQIKDDKQKWQQRLAELPNQQKLNNYKERLNQVKSSSGLAGLLGGASELVAVQKEIRADLDRLKAAQKDFNEDSAAYKKRLAAIQNAPQQDINHLVEKYSLSSAGLANLSALLFGGKTGTMLKQALGWYEKAQPLLQRHKEKKGGSEVVKPSRGQGVTVRFAEEEPLPDFLIRQISASVQITAGGFAGTIMNVTPDQDILGVPLTFNFAGDSLKGLRAIKCAGVLDHVNPAQPKDTVNLEISGYTLDKMVLSSSESLPVTINQGLADLAVQAEVQQRNINATIQAQLKSVSFATIPPQQGNAISQAIAGALADVKNLTATAKVTGTLDDYQLQLSSDLDNLLKQAAASAIKSQTAKFEQKLKEAVMEKTKGPLADATGSFADFGGISEELTARLQSAGNLL